MKKDICLAYWRWALAQLATAKHTCAHWSVAVGFRWRRIITNSTARMAREGELSLNYRDNDQYVITQLQCNSSRGWKQRCATRRAHPAVQQRRSVLWRSNV